MYRSLACIAFLCPVLAWPAAAHQNRTVAIVHSPDSRECTFFRLTDVTEADPVSYAGNPWFAVPKTHTGYKEIVATLLLARATGMPLAHVVTTSALACGHAEVGSLSI